MGAPVPVRCLAATHVPPDALARRSRPAPVGSLEVSGLAPLADPSRDRHRGALSHVNDGGALPSARDLEPMATESPGLCPTLRPTRKQFERPFSDYVREQFTRHPDWPCFKVVPPEGWRPTRDLRSKLEEIRIDTPIRQHVFGRGGAYQCIFEEQRSVSAADFERMANSASRRPPANVEDAAAREIRDGGPEGEDAERLGRVAAGPASTSDDDDGSGGGGGRRRAAPARRSRRLAGEAAEPRGLAGAPPEEGEEGERRPGEGGPGRGGRGDLDGGGDARREGAGRRGSEEGLLDRSFWSSVAINPPLYGADTPTSLFDERLTYGWNLRHLQGCLLTQREVPAIPGVTTPMTYFGQWKSFFGWHKEDLDLFSINYNHLGAAKVWYCVRPSDGEAFDRMARAIFPHLARACGSFVRHKDVMVSPRLLRRHGVPYIRAIQRSGEFIVLNAAAYHSGFNLGFNVAEAVNFALPEWLSIGKRCDTCECGLLPDAVQLDVRKYFRGMLPDTGSSSSSESDSDGSESGAEDGSEGEGDVSSAGEASDPDDEAENRAAVQAVVGRGKNGKAGVAAAKGGVAAAKAASPEAPVARAGTAKASAAKASAATKAPAARASETKASAATKAPAAKASEAAKAPRAKTLPAAAALGVGVQKAGGAKLARRDGRPDTFGRVPAPGGKESPRPAPRGKESPRPAPRGEPLAGPPRAEPVVISHVWPRPPRRSPSTDGGGGLTHKGKRKPDDGAPGEAQCPALSHLKKQPRGTEEARAARGAPDPGVRPGPPPETPPPALGRGGVAAAASPAPSASGSTSSAASDDRAVLAVLVGGAEAASRGEAAFRGSPRAGVRADRGLARASRGRPRLAGAPPAPRGSSHRAWPLPPTTRRPFALVAPGLGRAAASSGGGGGRGGDGGGFDFLLVQELEGPPPVDAAASAELPAADPPAALAAEPSGVEHVDLTSDDVGDDVRKVAAWTGAPAERPPPAASRSHPPPLSPASLPHMVGLLKEGIDGLWRPSAATLRLPLSSGAKPARPVLVRCEWTRRGAGRRAGWHLTTKRDRILMGPDE